MKLAIAPIRLAAPLGVVLGLAIASLAVASWQMPAGGTRLGADVTIAVQPSGELGVDPVGRIVTATGLEPGGPSTGAGGSVDVRNQTSTGLALALRAVPSTRDLDDSLSLILKAGDRQLFRGALGELRSWTERSLVLRPGAAVEVEAHAWIPRRPDRDRYRGRLVPLQALSDSPRAYAGRIEDIVLEFRTKPTAGSR